MMILPAMPRRHPWEMPWRMLVSLWGFRILIFVWLWKANGATAFGASQSLTLQALFDVVAWLYGRAMLRGEMKQSAKGKASPVADS